MDKNCQLPTNGLKHWGLSGYVTSVHAARFVSGDTDATPQLRSAHGVDREFVQKLPLWATLPTTHRRQST